MHAEWTLNAGLLFSFLLVLSRVACIFVFTPLPGGKSMPDVPKVVFALAITFAVFPSWPRVDPGEVEMGRMILWVATEVAFGLMIGLFIGFLLEAFVAAAQIAGLQAGYSYASTIDPTTQADSGILPICMQLFAGMLFFALGLDRWVVRIIAQSLSTLPPGAALNRDAAINAVVHLGTTMFSTGLKLALPVIALLILMDIALALLGRIASQLQLLTLAFPLKMLGALAALAGLAVVLPAAYEKAAIRTMDAISAVMR
jgi:flagellar biosynthetic protein FliR